MPVSPHDLAKVSLLTAAANRQLVILRCMRCRRSASYLAADLARVFGPSHPAHAPPFPCSRCGTAEFVKVRLRSPSSGEVASTRIRRPLEGDRRRWRDVPLSEVWPSGG